MVKYINKLLLDDKYFIKYYNLFKYSSNKYNLLNKNLLFNFTRYDNKVCNQVLKSLESQTYSELFRKDVDTGFRKNSPYLFENYIIDKFNENSNKSLIITNGITILDYVNNYSKYNNYDFILYYNSQFSIQDIKIKTNKINTYNKLKLLNNLLNQNDCINYLNNLKNNNNKKNYNLICISIPDFAIGLSPSYNSTIQISNLLISLIISIINLKKNANLIILFSIINSCIPIIKKLIGLLVSSFNKVEIVSDDINQNIFIGPTEFYIKCEGFKDNLSNDLLNKLIDATIESFNYNYNICDVIDYYDQYTKENPGHSLFYNRKEDESIKRTLKQMRQSRKSSKLDSSFFKSSKSSKTKSISRTKKSSSKTTTSNKKVKPIYYIEDLNIPELDEILADNDVAFKTDLLLNQLEYLFVSYFEMVNNLILTSIARNDKGELYVTEDAIKKKDITNLTRIVAMLEYNKIPYNKHALDVILEKRSEIIDTFYSLDNTIKMPLISYEDRMTKNLTKQALMNAKISKPYAFELFNEYFERINMSNLVKHNLLTELDLDRAPQPVRTAAEDYTRGINKYIMQRYPNLPIDSISNAFVKLWEILMVFHQLVPRDRTSFRTLHICEAPGQMIKALEYFVDKKRPRIRNYDWRANSLNPKSPINIAKYGKNNIFSDTYGLMKNNYNKWLWGADGTGDVTKPANIKWFKEYTKPGGRWLKPGEKLDLIVGDAGLSTRLFDSESLQILDLGQMVTVLATSQKGGNCCIKHFTPFIKRDKETYNSGGFFVGYMFMYYSTFEKVSLFKPYSSDPAGGEFYLIGQGFKGIDDDEIARLYKLLDNFKANDAIIEKDKIPETFIMQINQFINRMSMLNTMANEKQNLLLTCYKSQVAANPEKYNFIKPMQGKDKGKGKKETKDTTKESKSKEEYEKVNRVLKCDRFLDQDNLENILNARFKEWIDIYDFE